jgi:hypothetical protein
VFLMPYVFLALPGKETGRPAQHILTTTSGVFSAVFFPCTENSRPVQHILTTPFGVFLMSCVFLAQPGKGAADLCNTFLQHLLVCF